ncbi:MAG TPA: HAD family hydrolase [Candidatus Saccharimonadales bacterium]
MSEIRNHLQKADNTAELAIYWDWDGCIAKTIHLWIGEYTKTFEKEGIVKTRAEVISSNGAFLADIQSWGYSFAEAKCMVDATHARVVGQLPDAELYPGALETIQTLGARGYRQAIVTTSKQHYLQPALQRHGLEDHFQAIVAGDHVEHGKPHRESIDRAHTLLGGLASRGVLIGDSKKDLQTATNAGIPSILYYPPENEEFYSLHELRAYNPTYEVRDMAEIVPLIESL